jgi:hypothetical protein
MWLSLLINAAVSGLFAAVISGFINYYLESSRDRQQKKWLIKRDACFSALELTNKIYTNRFQHEGTVPESISEAEARKCLNELIVSVDNQEVIQLFKKIVLDGGWQADIIVDLRWAVRKELFGDSQIYDMDRNSSFLVKFAWSREDLKP